MPPAIGPVLFVCAWLFEFPVLTDPYNKDQWLYVNYAIKFEIIKNILTKTVEIKILKANLLIGNISIHLKSLKT